MWREALGFITLFASLIGLAVIAIYSGPSRAQVSPDTQLVSPEQGIAYVQDVKQYGPDNALLLRTLQTARDPSELASLTEPDTTLIVLDEISIKTVDVAFLREKLESGVAIMALNVPLSELASATDFVALFNRNPRPFTPDLSGLYGERPVERPFYSFVSMAAPGSANFQAGWGQKPFSADFFEVDLERHLGGIYRSVGGR